MSGKIHSILDNIWGWGKAEEAGEGKPREQGRKPGNLGYVRDHTDFR